MTQGFLSIIFPFNRVNDELAAVSQPKPDLVLDAGVA
jgi:hypothetical protein